MRKRILIGFSVGLAACLGAAGARPAPAQEVRAGRPAGVTTFTAPSVRDQAALDRLLEVLRKTPGVRRAIGRLAAGGGAQLRIAAEAAPEALVRAAKDAGIELRPEVAPPRFLLPGEPARADVEKLREALARLEGAGPVQVERSPRGVVFALPDARVTPREIVAAAGAAGFEIRPLEDAPARPGRPAATGERNTPAARGERITQDLTRVGEPAPDFTLITRDGKEKITLSDFRGRKPVVLVFGSYT